MDDEQATRIAVGAVILGLLPYIPAAIKHYLAFPEDQGKSAWYVIGKRLGRLFRKNS